MSHEATTSRPRRARLLRDWGLILLMAAAFKAFYSSADPLQLQWLLQPLALLLNQIGGFAFQQTGSGEWLDARQGVVIIKACSGGNFLIASWLGYLWRWYELPLDMTKLLRAAGAAWLTTWLANSLRILLIVHGQDDLAHATGLSGMDSHRLIGILVYFGVLSLQLAGARTLLAAPVIYLGVVVLAPWMHALVSGRNGINATYVLWAGGLPVASLIGYGIWWLGHRCMSEPSKPIGSEQTEANFSRQEGFTDISRRTAR